MLIYAIPEDLAAWAGETVPGAERLLRSASMLITRDTTCAYYATVDGKPSNPAVADAFRDAACAQATFWHRLGIDPATAGLDQAPVVASKELAGAKIVYGLDPKRVALLTIAADTMCPEAAAILREAGLLDGGPAVL